METLTIALTISLFVMTSVASGMPTPKEGLLISKNESENIREKVIDLGDPSFDETSKGKS